MSKANRRALFVLPALLLIIFGVAFNSIILKQLHTWKVLPEPEGITELYFSAHTKLPVSYLPGSQQLISFTVHNLEYAPKNYTYSVIQTSEDGISSVILARGTFKLESTKLMTSSLPINLSDFGKRSKVTVHLNTSESISYWVTKGSI